MAKSNTACIALSSSFTNAQSGLLRLRWVIFLLYSAGFDVGCTCPVPPSGCYILAIAVWGHQ